MAVSTYTEEFESKTRVREVAESETSDFMAQASAEESIQNTKVMIKIVKCITV